MTYLQKVMEEPINYDYELHELVENDFEMIYLMDDNYIGYIHKKSGFEIEYNTLNLKNCYTIFPFGRGEYYEKESKGSLIEVDTLIEVKQILAKHKIIK
jgi:hypothetical protein